MSVCPPVTRWYVSVEREINYEGQLISIVSATFSVAAIQNVFIGAMCWRVISCVCPSVTIRYCIETPEQIELVLALRLPSVYTILHWNGIRLYPK